MSNSFITPDEAKKWEKYEKDHPDMSEIFGFSWNKSSNKSSFIKSGELNNAGTIKILIGYDGSSSIDKKSAALLGVSALYDNYIDHKKHPFRRYLSLNDYPVLRTDPVLIRAIESKSEKFLHDHNIHLRIVCIPVDVKWIVEEDGETGSECISEVHRTWY